MNILSPSILSADFWNLGEAVRLVEQEQIPWLHIDVMDGAFVPSISYGMPVIKCLRKHSDLFFDVHLMIDEPKRYVADFADCGADLINFHIEATDQVEETIAAIRALNKKVGITIKPATPVEELAPYLELVDMVLVMSVEPGYGGQGFIYDMLPKLKVLREYADKNGFEKLDIQVDGGINEKTGFSAVNAGANVLVAGTGLFKAPDMKSVCEALKGN